MYTYYSISYNNSFPSKVVRPPSRMIGRASPVTQALPMFSNLTICATTSSARLFRIANTTGTEARCFPLPSNQTLLTFCSKLWFSTNVRDRYLAAFSIFVSFCGVGFR